GWIWELPAGKLEPNEPPLITAQRELVEEAGVSAQHWESLDSYFSSPGIFTEIVHLYLATGITPAVASLESAEVIEVHWMPFEEAFEWAMNGTIRDGKTLIGLMRAHHLRTTRKAADSTYLASP
ncbi:MAG TPA: NUDIX hydrolase, partial [Steroidobacteraceae bacterium]